MVGATLSDEARFELAMAAAARERRNRPRHLVVLAAMLVLAALAACLWSARAWSVAGREAKAALARRDSLEAQVQEYLDLKAKAGGAEADASGGFAKFISTAESAATAAGLSRPRKPIEPERPIPRGNILDRSWRYNGVQSAQAGALMKWVQSVLEKMPGVRVSSIKLTPGAQGWTMDVVFAGAERVGGGT